MISKHTCRWSDKQRVPRFVSIKFLIKILYLIFDYPHKHYTFKHFEI